MHCYVTLSFCASKTSQCIWTLLRIFLLIWAQSRPSAQTANSAKQHPFPASSLIHPDLIHLDRLIKDRSDPYCGLSHARTSSPWPCDKAAKAVPSKKTAGFQTPKPNQQVLYLSLGQMRISPGDEWTSVELHFSTFFDIHTSKKSHLVTIARDFSCHDFTSWCRTAATPVTRRSSSNCITSVPRPSLPGMRHSKDATTTWRWGIQCCASKPETKKGMSPGTNIWKSYSLRGGRCSQFHPGFACFWVGLGSVTGGWAKVSFDFLERFQDA